MAKMNRTTVTLTNGKSFTVIHTLPMGGIINSFDAVLDNWRSRAKELTAESLVEYINKPFKRGKSEYFALTEEQFNKYK